MAEDNNLDGSAGVIAGLLDPVADTIEKGLSKIGLGKVAKAWIKGESTVLLLGLLNGMKNIGADYVAKTTGPAVMNLSAGRQVVESFEIDEAMLSAAVSGLEGFAKTMELSPSYQLDEVVKDKTGSYGGEHLIAGAKRVGNIFNK
jgi:hypothetical protein